jgi:CIC family chloride channel protein
MDDAGTSREGSDPGDAESAFFQARLAALRLLSGGRQRFWLLVAATGALAGVGSAVLFLVLGLVERVAWASGGSFIAQVEASSPLRRAFVPALAGLLVTVASLVARRPLAGHGTARIIEAIWHRGRELVLGRTLLRALLSIVAVGMGASLGREGALVSTGAASGSWLANRFRLTEMQVRVLVACGAASGIAAAYDVPVGGALFGLEVLLGSFALELLGPIVVACVVAVTVAHAIPIPHPSYLVPHYELLRPPEILLGLGFAPVLGLASAVYVRVLGWVEVQLDRVPRWTAPLLPPLALLAAGAASIWWPQIPGNGFDTVNEALLGHLPVGLLLVLPLAKLSATAVSAGSGVPGGLFTPSLFYGATIGALLGAVVSRLWPGLAPPGAMALIGMAGVLAGTTHAVVSSVVIIFEMTGDYGVVLPLMLSAALAASISRFVEPDSLYTAPLRRSGVKLPELPRPEWLRTTPVDSLVSKEAERVSPTLPFDAVVKRLLALPAGHDLYVTSEDSELIGVIRLDALKGTIGEQALLGMLVASDVVDRSVEPITTSMHLQDVVARFREVEVDRLPVVDARRRLVGTVAVRDLLALGRF